MPTIFQIEKTSSEFTLENPTLARGQRGLETDTLLRKVGDGVTSWGGLVYWAPGGSEAQEFLDAAGITDTTISNATESLVATLKSIGVWPMMRAVYPFVGGTEATHKWNLVDPQDTDAAFRLTFTGGWVHSATGALPNGTTGFADTKFNPSVTSLNNNTHMSFYCRTESQVGIDMGTVPAGTNRWWMASRYSVLGGNAYSECYHATDRLTLGNDDARGFYVSNRSALTINHLRRNGVSGVSGTSASGIPPNGKIYIGAISDGAGVASEFSNKQVAFASIGDSMTGQQITDFSAAVQTFQTALGRQV